MTDERRQELQHELESMPAERLASWAQHKEAKPVGAHYLVWLRQSPFSLERERHVRALLDGTEVEDEPPVPEPVPEVIPVIPEPPVEEEVQEVILEPEVVPEPLPVAEAVVEVLPVADQVRRCLSKYVSSVGVNPEHVRQLGHRVDGVRVVYSASVGQAEARVQMRDGTVVVVPLLLD